MNISFYLNVRNLSQKLNICFTLCSLSQLDIEQLDSTVLNQMQSLEVLDVSQNRLRNFPNDLDLPKLRKLDCSDNRLSTVKFLEQFPKLKELYLLGNGMQVFHVHS